MAWHQETRQSENDFLQLPTYQATSWWQQGQPIRERGVGETSQSCNNTWTSLSEYNPELQKCLHSSFFKQF